MPRKRVTGRQLRPALDTGEVRVALRDRGGGNRQGISGVQPLEHIFPNQNLHTEGRQSEILPRSGTSLEFTPKVGSTCLMTVEKPVRACGKLNVGLSAQTIGSIALKRGTACWDIRDTPDDVCNKQGVLQPKHMMSANNKGARRHGQEY